MKEKANEMLFHNEDVVSRLTLWGNIVAFIVLTFSMVGFIYNMYSIIINWSQVAMSLPPSLIEKIAIFMSKVFYEPVVGVFYFLVLRGMVQLLNIGRDLYYGAAEEIEIIEESPAK
jgi:hypothetical protein